MTACAADVLACGRDKTVHLYRHLSFVERYENDSMTRFYNPLTRERIAVVDIVRYLKLNLSIPWNPIFVHLHGVARAHEPISLVAHRNTDPLVQRTPIAADPRPALQRDHAGLLGTVYILSQFE